MTARLNAVQPYALGLFRIVVGLLFACHGAASLFGVLGGAGGSGATVETGAWPNWYAAVIELVGGSLVLIGLGTRVASFLSSGAMAYAYFKVHQPTDLWPMENNGEGAAMFCWAFLLLIFTGSGAFGLDQLFAKRSTAADKPATEHTPVAA
jgi:putative oxidoreductase